MFILSQTESFSIITFWEITLDNKAIEQLTQNSYVIHICTRRNFTLGTLVELELNNKIAYDILNGDNR